MISLVGARAAGKTSALPESGATSQMDGKDYIIFAKVCEPAQV